MSLLRNIGSGVRSLFRKEQVGRELDEKLRAYQEMAAEEKMKDGLSPKEALRAVRLERGSLEVNNEIVRSGGWEFLVETKRFAPCETIILIMRKQGDQPARWPLETSLFRVPEPPRRP